MTNSVGRAAPSERSRARVPLLDIGRQQAPLAAEFQAAFQRVFDSGRYILGEEVAAFEAEVAQALQVKYAIGVSNGSDALMLALLAAGVSEGDEVITTSFSFFATVGSILRIGALPRFADLEQGGFNLCPSSVEALVTERTRAVIAVHLFGEPAAMPALKALCEARGLVLIEDAAQAFGASIEGQRAGCLGDIGCFSFFPSKPLGGLGDGGLLTTSRPELYERLRLLRAHGAPKPHQHEILGGNFRLDALQAAFLRVKLPHVEAWRSARAERAAVYTHALDAIQGYSTPKIRANHVSAWAHYTLRLVGGLSAHREELRQLFNLRGIDSALYYPKPLYAQPVPELQRVLVGNEAARCPEAELRCREVISLPLFAELEPGEQQRVVETLIRFAEERPE